MSRSTNGADDHARARAGAAPCDWNHTAVTVSFVCDDAPSGLAFWMIPLVVNAEGKAQKFTGRAVDNAGNAADDTALVSIEETAPTITAATDRPANDTNWSTPTSRDLRLHRPPLESSQRARRL